LISGKAKNNRPGGGRSPAGGLVRAGRGIAGQATKKPGGAEGGSGLGQ